MITEPESDVESFDMKPEKRFTDNDLVDLKLKAVDENEWVLVKYEVQYGCSVKELIIKKGQIFKRGCAFYEFNNDFECISEGQLLMICESVCNHVVYCMIF